MACEGEELGNQQVLTQKEASRASLQGSWETQGSCLGWGDWGHRYKQVTFFRKEKEKGEKVS